jgi:hypothetical protein
MKSSVGAAGIVRERKPAKTAFNTLGDSEILNQRRSRNLNGVRVMH